jgi:hypothetical protein
VFADKLADEQRLVGDSSAAEAQLADLDGQIKQVGGGCVGGGVYMGCYDQRAVHDL